MKSKAPPSSAGICPLLLVPKGAIEGVNGSESQSSAAILFNDGMKVKSDIVCDIGVLSIVLTSLFSAVLLSYHEDGPAGDILVFSRLFFVPFDDDASRLRLKRDTCISSSMA